MIVYLWKAESKENIMLCNCLPVLKNKKYPQFFVFFSPSKPISTVWNLDIVLLCQLYKEVCEGWIIMDIWHFETFSKSNVGLYMVYKGMDSIMSLYE